jgi:hypothetical protein
VTVAQVAERVPGLLARGVAADHTAGRRDRRAAVEVVDDVGHRERVPVLGAKAADDGDAGEREDRLRRAAGPDRPERARQAVAVRDVRQQP